MWCVPILTDEYIERMEDLLDLYEKDYNPKEPVLCFDEKSKQLLEDVYDPIPAKPGKLRKVDNEYKRCSTVNIFVAVEPKTGKYFTYVTEKRRRSDFAKVLYRITKQYSKARTIHLVLDNLNIHTMKSLTDFYGEKKGKEIWGRFTVHYTPKHGSWLNQAEIAISILTNQCLGKIRFPDIQTLRKQVWAWNKKINKKKLKISWAFTKIDAKEKFKY